jgi:hypothetical protein
MFNPFKAYSRMKHFDEVTRFRLINSFIVAIGLNLFWPILMDLKGEYLVAWVISMFMIIETLMIKTNSYMVEKYSISTIYKGTVILHLSLIFVSLMYFWNPLIMIIVESLLAIFEVTIISAYTIVLNDYLAKNYPESMKDFQVIRNSTYADGTLIGLGLITAVVFFFGNTGGIVTFVIFNACFSVWLIKNWNFFDNKGL